MPSREGIYGKISVLDSSPSILDTQINNFFKNKLKNYYKRALSEENILASTEKKTLQWVMAVKQ